MSQLAASDGQPGNWEEPGFFLRRLEIARSKEECRQEPCESRGSRTVLRGTGGEIPPVYPTLKIGQFVIFYDITAFQRRAFVQIISINHSLI